MAVEVLSPRDCHKDSLSRQSVMNFNRNPNPNPSRLGRPSRPQNDGKNRRPTRPNNLPRPVQKSPAPQNLVMGQVKILKRGEEIPKTVPAPPPQKQNFKPQVPAPPPQKQNPKPQVPDLGNTNLMGPAPKRVPKQTKNKDSNLTAGFYAGSSSCIASPPPSSLPLPSFFAKKSVVSSTDAAASELLKLLRLNLS
ncbi:hypothetical protein ACFX2I_017130 [Malus domestica]|uniref:pollen-specific leucine-rich repeat extensin-like protein 2 n=1 Tax=Malus domestica TaxID=3750 RepID=UPI000498F594|nr:pollen-specific leucine-rich repeat extensin-like protein 1 [Malus domestica]XP_050127837.1 pollen-specific leucine-rich repeat extensin-like protein 1 [Malus sylvestris]